MSLKDKSFYQPEQSTEPAACISAGVSNPESVSKKEPVSRDREKFAPRSLSHADNNNNPGLLISDTQSCLYLNVASLSERFSAAILGDVSVCLDEG